MTCDDIRRRILERDHNTDVPREISRHIEECPECRALARRVADAESILLVSEAPEPEVVDSVLARVAKVPIPALHQNGALGGWFFGGLLLTGAVVGVRYSRPFRYLAETVLGARVDLAVTMAIGLVLVAYLVAFVLTSGSHLRRRKPVNSPYE